MTPKQSDSAPADATMPLAQPLVSAAPSSIPAQADAPPAIDRRQLRSRVFRLAGPIIGENFLETMLGIVDTLLVARLGAAAIAGVGGAMQIMFFVIAVLSALSVGSAVLVAQAVGGRRWSAANGLARQSLVWSLLISVPLALIGVLLAAPIMAIFGMQPDVATIGTQYLQVTMATVVVLVARLIGSGALRGAGDSRTPMYTTAIANVVNIFLTYGLIYGAFGLPAMGAVGSAWATFAARSLALVLLLAVLWRGSHGLTIRGTRSWLPDLRVARAVLRIGVPAGLEQVLVTSGFLALTVLVASLGTATLAAHRIAFNALSLSFLPGFGFSLAATALVGQSYGARRMDEGAVATRISATWAVVWMSIIALIVFVFAAPIMGLYTDDPAVIAAGALGLPVVAASQPFWGILFVHAGALRGTGNTRFPMLVTGTGIWCSVGLAYLMVHTWGDNLGVVWLAFLVVAPVMALLQWWRFRREVENHRRSAGLTAASAVS